MEWIKVLTIIGTILIPMFSGFGWIIVKLFKMQKEISGIRPEILEMKIELLDEVRGLDSRLSHLEGYLIGYNQKTGSDKGK